MEKELTRIDKNGDEIPKNISYILQFIGRARFVGSSLSNLGNNISEFIKLNVNKDTIMKNVKIVELNSKFATVFLNTQILLLQKVAYLYEYTNDWKN